MPGSKMITVRFSTAPAPPKPSLAMKTTIKSWSTIVTMAKYRHRNQGKACESMENHKGNLIFFMWKLIPWSSTEEQIVFALDDSINPKSGRNIFGCAHFHNHTTDYSAQMMFCLEFQKGDHFRFFILFNWKKSE